MEKEKELLVEEVNVYVDDCGNMKLRCNTDCPFNLPFISTND